MKKRVRIIRPAFLINIKYLSYPYEMELNMENFCIFPSFQQK